MYKIFLTAAIILTAVITTQPTKASTKTIDVNEHKCLADALYRESRGESLRGQVLVGETVINRTKDKNYPNTICGVVKQKGKNSKGKLVCQFSWNCMKLPPIDPNNYKTSYYIAKFLLEHKLKDISHGSVFFFKDDELKYVKDMGIRLVAREGVHGFYVLKNRA